MARSSRRLLAVLRRLAFGAALAPTTAHIGRIRSRREDPLRLKNFTERDRAATAGRAPVTRGAISARGVPISTGTARAMSRRRRLLEKSPPGKCARPHSAWRSVPDSDPPTAKRQRTGWRAARQLGFSAPAQAPGAPPATQQAPRRVCCLPRQLTDPAVRREARGSPPVMVTCRASRYSRILWWSRATIRAWRAGARSRGGFARHALLIRRGAACDAADQHGVTPG